MEPGRQDSCRWELGQEGIDAWRRRGYRDHKEEAGEWSLGDLMIDVSRHWRNGAV